MEEFCGMETLAAPKDMFWTPDIGIVERYTKRLVITFRYFTLHYYFCIFNYVQGFLMFVCFFIKQMMSWYMKNKIGHPFIDT